MKVYTIETRGKRLAPGLWTLNGDVYAVFSDGPAERVCTLHQLEVLSDAWGRLWMPLSTRQRAFLFDGLPRLEMFRVALFSCSYNQVSLLWGWDERCYEACLEIADWNAFKQRLDGI